MPLRRGAENIGLVYLPWHPMLMLMDEGIATELHGSFSNFVS